MYYNQSITLPIFSRAVRQLLISCPKCYATKPKISSKDEKSSNIDDVEESPGELGASFFAKNIGANYWKWHPLLKKHPELKTLKPQDVINSMNLLKKYNFSLEDVMMKPMILYVNEMTLENRYSVLQECGIQTVTMSLLSKFVAVVNKTTVNLKSYGYIPMDIDVVERLRQCFIDIDVELNSKYPCNENIELRLLRQNILNHYLQQRIDMSASELEKLWKVYARIRHKSFMSTHKIMAVLLNDLQFPKERIRKNNFILHADADNVKRIITEIPTIDGQDIKEILLRRPKIMMSSCDALLSTLQHIKDFGINENAVIRCLEVLTLGPDTVLERLKDLNEIEEFQVLTTNPRILRLIHYQNKARLRLDYLNQLKVKCASLHILCCASQSFAKFARDGSDRTKGRDVVVYLSRAMDKSEDDLRSLLSRHPNWCHIPALHIKQCYEFLQSKKFKNEDIYNNIHLLLYPIKRIEEKLEYIKTPKFFEEINMPKSKQLLEANEVLTLALYFIECECHFTGDGIWTEQHTQHVENFHNLLPDFPESLNKSYKYGVKAPETQAMETRAKRTFKDCVI